MRARFAALSDQVKAETGRDLAPADLAEGFVAIAVQNMAEAIKAISISRGHDVTGYALNCFGGAGGQHACLVADALGMTTVMLHPFAGVLSAYGMGLAEVRAIRQATAALPLSPDNDPDLAARAPIWTPPPAPN
nr:hydantoinase/oxoprolinase family protein [Brevundimonas denitrificans]